LWVLSEISSDFGDLHVLPTWESSTLPGVRRILVEREMRARLMVIGEIVGQDAA
jgi:hypothetical protein